MFSHITDKFITVIKKDTILKSSGCLTCNGAKHVSLFISIQGTLNMPKPTSSTFPTHVDAADVASPAISVLVQDNSLGPEQSVILRDCFQIRLETARHPQHSLTLAYFNMVWTLKILWLPHVTEWAMLEETTAGHLVQSSPWLRNTDTCLSL